jgi:hypothetical protein
MRVTKLPAVFLSLVFAGQPASGVDLAKIDRIVRKEPAYQTKAPKYCLLVFGPEAKLRVWLVLDGEVLYVDQNEDGDLTGAAKVNPKNGRFEIGPLASSDGKTRYPVMHVVISDRRRINVLGSGSPSGNGSGRWEAPGHTGTVELADRPQDAPILHLDGPLTLYLLNATALKARHSSVPSVFVRGDKPSFFCVGAGTPGLGKGAFTVSVLENCPDAVAEVVFPNRVPSAKPIVVKVPVHAPL